MQNTRLDVPLGVPVELCTTYMHYSRRTPRGALTVELCMTRARRRGHSSMSLFA